jgi:RNA polymerase sigma factor (sigma-70 family)
MAIAEQPEHVLLEQLDWIERVGASICKRSGVASEEASEFVSAVRLRLIENDYAVLRKFRGESSIRTFLAVVIASFFRDYRVAKWGRWRPSAEARRAGRVAVRLETLIMRDHHSLVEAGELLRSAGETALTNRELGQLLMRLPRRAARPVEVGSEALDLTADPSGAGEIVEADEMDAARLTALRALDQAIGRLSSEDQVILRLRYWEGLGVSDIARALRVPQKPLYRRLERTTSTLRDYLAANGISDVMVREILTWTTEAHATS